MLPNRTQRLCVRLDFAYLIPRADVLGETLKGGKLLQGVSPLFVTVFIIPICPLKFVVGTNQHGGHFVIILITVLGTGLLPLGVFERLRLLYEMGIRRECGVLAVLRNSEIQSEVIHGAMMAVW